MEQNIRPSDVHDVGTTPTPRNRLGRLLRSDRRRVALLALSQRAPGVPTLLVGLRVKLSRVIHSKRVRQERKAPSHERPAAEGASLRGGLGCQESKHVDPLRWIGSRLQWNPINALTLSSPIPLRLLHFAILV